MSILKRLKNLWRLSEYRIGAAQVLIKDSKEKPKKKQMAVIVKNEEKEDFTWE